jgi:hypothetical protein
MEWLLSLRLIRLFDFYLILAFFFSTFLRVQQYRTILGVVRAVPGRWPKLFQLVKQHRNLFLTWGTILPLALTLGLWLGNTLLRRLVLSEGEDLTIQGLLRLWPAVPVVAASGMAMLGFDFYGAITVDEINKGELEKYFDQAEFWLRSWTAPVVSFVTLGYVNPRKIVAVEVQAALVSASETINSSLWWLSIQAVLRVVFGLSVWVSFLFTRGS